MALKAGRVGVSPSSVDLNGNVKGAQIELVTENVALAFNDIQSTEDKGSLYQLNSRSNFRVQIGEDPSDVFVSTHDELTGYYSIVYFVPKAYNVQLLSEAEGEAIGYRTYFK